MRVSKMTIESRQRTHAASRGHSGMANQEPKYIPPDPTQIDPRPEKIQRAVQKVGPILETVKKELGIGGVG